MNDANRDLLVLALKNQFSPAELECQIQALDKILYHTETWDFFCTANELLDISRHKIISKPHLIQKLLTEKSRKPFVFICNKN